MNVRVRDFEVCGDGSAVSTDGIQQAVDHCARTGGGRVTIDPGFYRTGSLFLRDHVELHLQHGAVLRGVDVEESYRPQGTHDTSLTDNARFSAILNAVGVSDVAITGRGMIHGGGDLDHCPQWADVQGTFRPAVIYFQDCREYLLQDFAIEGSRWWTVHLLRCVDGAVRGIRIRNNWPNSDGIDPDGCRKLTISDCRIEAGDDCIVAKSTKGDDCENLTVTNCLLKTTCACIKLGTESLGSFRNMAFSNCVLSGSIGFALYMKDGGMFENISAVNLLFQTEHEFPLILDAMPRDYRSGRPAGQIQNIRLDDIQFSGPGRIWMEGTEDQPVRNVSLTNVSWHATAPLRLTEGGKPLGSARVIVDPSRPDDAARPFQLIGVNVEGLRVAGFQLSGEIEDRRFAYLRNVRDAELDYRASGLAAGAPVEHE